MSDVATRRPHTKSRLGCVQCKARKVKCDRAAPACSACVRRKEVCSLTDVQLYLVRSSSSSAKASPLQHSPQFPSNASTPISLDIPPRAHQFSTIYLELTHLYSTRTWNTLMLRPEAAALWKDTFVGMALEKPVLLDALLSTAAMQRLALESESPKRDAYTNFIKRKGAQLIPFILSMLREPSEEDRLLLFASSILLTIWAFASAHLPPSANLFTMHSSTSSTLSTSDLGRTVSGNHMPRLDEFLAALNISLGSRSVGRHLAPIVQNPCFSTLSAVPVDYELLPPVSTDIRLALDVLDVHWKATSPSPQRRATYELQMCRLRDLFRIEHVPEWRDMIVGFAIRFPQDMICLLSERDPCALVILAYWTAVLRVVEDVCWWLRPEGLYAEIEGVLEAEWKTHLRVLSRFLT